MFSIALEQALGNLNDVEINQDGSKWLERRIDISKEMNEMKANIGNNTMEDWPWTPASASETASMGSLLGPAKMATVMGLTAVTPRIMARRPALNVIEGLLL